MPLASLSAFCTVLAVGMSEWDLDRWVPFLTLVSGAVVSGVGALVAGAVAIIRAWRGQPPVSPEALAAALHQTALPTTNEQVQAILRQITAAAAAGQARQLPAGDDARQRAAANEPPSPR